MAGSIKISELPDADVLDGTEYIGIVQGGDNKKTTPVAFSSVLGLGSIATQDASAVAITGGSITGITDLAIADGGTGASDAATARTNLGLGTMATQAASSVAITGGSVAGITDLAIADGGTGSSDAATAAETMALPYVVADRDALKALTARPPIVAVRTGAARGTWRWASGDSTTADDVTAVQCTSANDGRYLKIVYVDAVDVKTYGATGDGVANDRARLMDMETARNYIRLAPGVYALTTAQTTVLAEGDRLEVQEEASIAVASGAVLDVNCAVTAPRAQIFSGAGKTRVTGADWVLPEWIGVTVANTAADNTTAWNKYIADSTNYVTSTKDKWAGILFGRFTYEFEAPFYLPQMTEVRGLGFGATTFHITGSDEHAVETVNVTSGNVITTDTTMDDNCDYPRLIGISVDASDMTFTTGTRRAMLYFAGVSGGDVIGCQFLGPAAAANQMDGILLVPTRATQASGNHFATTRCQITDNRITWARDAIVCGRTDDTFSEDEPASGGAGDYIGGDCYDNVIERNRIGMSTTIATYARFGIRVNYYDDSAASTSVGTRPYENRIVNNTIAFGTGYQTLSGTVSIAASSTTMTGTAFNTEIAPFLYTEGGFSVQMPNVASASHRNVRVVSVESDTSATINAADAYGSDRNDQLGYAWTGVGVFLDSVAGLNTVMGNHIEHGWADSIRLGEHSLYDLIIGNRGQTAAPRAITWYGQIADHHTPIIQPFNDLIWMPANTLADTDTSP